MTRSLTAIRREIRDTWTEIHAAARTLPEAKDALPLSPTLLGSSTKVGLGESLNVLTAVVYMSPADEAFAKGDGRTLCPFAGFCKSVCIGNETGRMIFAPMRLSRLWKTTLYLGARRLFRELLDAEIRAHAAKAKRLGMRAAVRVDGSTDTGEGADAALRHPDVMFYDYTKVAARAHRFARGHAANYHLTYSWSERASVADARALLAAGVNVAVAFKRPKHDLPATWLGASVIDGDLTDVRFADPRGVVVGLAFKSARRTAAKVAAGVPAGFIVEA